jgi:hypothetical protein
MLSLEVLTYYEWRWLSVVLDDEHVAVFGCSPFRTAAPDGDAVNAVDEAPLSIAVVKADVGVGLQFALVTIMAGTIKFQCRPTLALSPMPWSVSVTFVKPSAPILVNLAVFLSLFATLLHLVPFLFQYEVQYLYVDYFGHTFIPHVRL